MTRSRHCSEKCRDELDRLFDTLPLPKPSVTLRDEKGHVRTVSVSMSQYHDKNGVCFTAECQVRLIDRMKAEVDTLRNGIKVWAPKGGRSVAVILATSVK